MLAVGLRQFSTESSANLARYCDTGTRLIFLHRKDVLANALSVLWEREAKRLQWRSLTANNTEAVVGGSETSNHTVINWNIERKLRRRKQNERVC
jgi:hypothetical protein